jgi:hypothetical protein
MDWTSSPAMTRKIYSPPLASAKSCWNISPNYPYFISLPDQRSFGTPAVFGTTEASIGDGATSIGREVFAPRRICCPSLTT